MMKVEPRWLASGGVIVAGAAVFLANESYGWGAALLWIIGVTKLGYLPTLLRDEAGLRYLMLVFAVFGVYGALQTSLVDYPSSDSFKSLRFLLVWPIALAVVCYRVTPVSLFIGCALGAISAAFVACYELMVLHLDRANGLMHPIHFGNLALLLALIAGMGILYGKGQSAYRLLPIIYGTGLVAGIAASLMSGSRGGWVALPIAALLYGRIFAFTTAQSCKLLAVSFAMIGLIWMFKPNIGLEDRVAEAHADIIHAIQHDDYSSSVGQRLEMWRMLPAFVVIRPMTGVGDEGFVRYRNAWMASGEWRLVERFDHLHNDYIDVLARRGLIGLLLTGLLFYGSWRAFAQHTTSEDYRVRAVAGAGMLVPLLFSIYGLSEVMLMSKRGQVMYQVWVPLIYAFLLVARRTALRHPHPAKKSIHIKRNDQSGL